jgi:cation-transporting P-type ATPase I
LIGPARRALGASTAVLTMPLRIAATLVAPPALDTAEGTDATDDGTAADTRDEVARSQLLDDEHHFDLAALRSLVDVGPELVETALDEGVDLAADALGLHRRVWQDDDATHAQIEVHGIEDPKATSFRRRLAEAIAKLDEVRWAEVNALTGRVAVAFEGGRPTLASLLDLIEGIEDAHGARRADHRPGWDTDDRADHPADDEPVHRTIAIMLGDALSLGWVTIGRATRMPRVPVEFAGIITIVDNNPWLRVQAQRLLGRRVAALVLPLAGAAAAGISQGPLGLLVDLAYQGVSLGELRARRHAWHEREPEFYAVHSDDPIEPPDLDPRPIPLPDGPIETWSKRLGKVSFAGFAGTLLATRDPRRATDAVLAGTPKAARLGREGFAAHLGRTLAYRGVVPLDGSALRRLDRIDTVVVDADVLLTDRVRIRGAVTPTGGEVQRDHLDAAERLLVPEDGQADRRRRGWRLGPVDAVSEDVAELPRGTKTRIREIRSDGGRPLLLVRHGEVVAVVDTVADLDPGVDPVVEAVRRCGHRLLVAERRGHVAARIGADDTLPTGRAMGEAIRELQADGACVLVVGRQGHHGLAAADVGLGVVTPTGRPSWGADLILGRELADAATIVDATAVAREVSERSARFALVGSALGALVASTGPRTAAGRRGMAMVNGAAGASLVAGTWSAVRLSHEPRPQVPDRVTWHALSTERVTELLDVDPATGLASAEVRQRRAVTSTGGRDVSPTEPFLAELANPLNPVLGVGAGLSAAIGSMVDAGLVLGLIGVNTAVGGIQRLRADRTVRRLLRHDIEEVTVVRDGEEQRVPEDALVRGDVIVLHAGDAVPADARVLATDGCEVDESSLTGESLPIAKTAGACPEASVAERRCMLYEDTTIASGSVRAVVVATGDHTEVARSLALAGPPPPTGVEIRLDELTRRLLPAALTAALGTAGVGVLRRWPLRDVAGTAVSLAIASVPEGLPFVATAGQLAGARRLAESNAVVRNPRTVEALGRVDVLCVDKTGTLTEGRIALTAASDGRDTARVSDPDDLLRRILAAALRASGQVEDDDLHALDDTDAALHEAARRVEVAPDDGVSAWDVVTTLPFEASRGVHAVLGRAGDDHVLTVKGAPEAVLEACTSWRRNGEEVEVDDDVRAEILATVGALAGRGHRVLAVAERAASERLELEEDRLERLCLLGLLVLSDPVRPTAADAVRGIGQAGVRTVMVTGDHPETALSIAGRLGLEGGALTGSDLDALDDDELGEALAGTAVVARVTPAHKLRVVQVLQARGHVVAMTGDGANDAAAIRLAEVGVALGRRSSPAARDAADIVVTDDRIETLIAAIAEGRALWGSIREALAVLVGGNLGEIGFTSIASALSRQAPLDPRQFLLVNLLTDLAPAVAIAVRPPEDVSTETLLREGPEASLGSTLQRDIAIRGTATALGASAAWTAARFTGTRRRASTVGLVALVGTQLGQTMVAGGWRRPATLLTGLGSAGALVATVQTPGVSGFFGCRPLGPLGWAQATTAATLATAGSQVASWLVARHPAE